MGEKHKEENVKSESKETLYTEILEININRLIYTIRGQQVMLDSDLAMLSAVLRSDIAIQVSIKIMDSFVEMRSFLASNALMPARINEIENKQPGTYLFTDCEHWMYSIRDKMAYHGFLCHGCFYNGKCTTLYIRGSKEANEYISKAGIPGFKKLYIEL